MRISFFTPSAASFALLLLFTNGLTIQATLLPEGAIQVGAAKIDITPDEPIRLSGFGGRREPSEGVQGKLFAKAMAIGEGKETAIFVTLDLIGAPEWLTSGVVEELDLSESQVALCATHTHSGPHLRDVLNPIFMADIPSEHWAAIERYSDRLVDKVVSVCRMAMNNRQPAMLEWGQGEVGFAGNRRVLENGKWVGFGIQADGPVDHTLPVMKITDTKGDLMAVLANYACHCTTLGGDFNQYHGDWAGEAQRLLEERHPGTTAMIAIGCGADANPNPRGSMNEVLRHGKALADEVDRVIKTKLTQLTEVPATKLDWITLPFDPLPSREEWKEHAASQVKTAYYAKEILKRLDNGETLPTSMEYPIQTWTFGKDLAMVFLAGEVVVDYSFKLKERFDGDRIWINAYANAAPSYIASRRLYDEGGYEVDRSMLYYDKPTRLSPDTEDLVLDEVLKQMPYHFYSEVTLSRMPPPIPPEDALDTIVAHPDMHVELVAAEPMVLDPIDIDWGADGRMWVVEMGDYPLGLDGKGKPGGVVRFLEDEDGDGSYDRSVVFIDALTVPTSVMPWRDGVLIATPPDILFARDTNGDGKADDVSTLFTGFYHGNEQHLINGLEWGLDGWIYAANGDSGGDIRSTSAPPESAFNIDGLDVRMLPEKGLIEAILGRSQYGRNRDSWGNWFGNNNSKPGWHYSLDDAYLKRNPHVTYPEGKVQLSDPPIAPPVYPVSETLSRYNDYEKANRFTGISGVMIYEDDALGDDFIGNAFIAECVHNLVSRAVVYPDSATFYSKRAPEETEAEFFASTDAWFRPTVIRSGPDGALYIVDMYRLVIEHPEWIPMDWQRKLELREGHDMGRIFRVSKKGKTLRKVPRLDKMTPLELVAALDSNNRWQRDHVHQLLTWKPTPEIIKPLRKVATSGEIPEARGQALWVLSQLKGLDEATVLDCLSDPVGGVRQQAVCLSEPFLENSPTVLNKVLSLATDEHAQTQMQVAYSLGESKSSTAGKTLAQMALVHYDDRQILSAILSSAIPHQEILAEACKSNLLVPKYSRLLRGLSQTAIGSDNRRSLNALIAAILSPSGTFSEDHQFSAFAEFMQVLTRSGSSLEKLKSQADGSLSSTLEKAESLFQSARKLAQDHQASIHSRKNALRVLPYDQEGKSSNQSTVTGLLVPSVPAELQQDAVDALLRITGSRGSEILLEGWKGHSPSLRRKILEALLTNRRSTLTLLQRAASEPAVAKVFSAAQIAEITRHSDPQIKDLAEEVFGQFVVSNREQLIKDYEPSLALTGDAQAGRNQFAILCAMCHRMGDVGVDVGPDLTALTDKSARSLLVGTLDPNRAVEDKYSQYVATTQDGRTAVGILAEETSTSITMIGMGGIKQTLLRQNLKSLESSGTSLMPDGLEAGLDHQKMADLIAFMTASDESMKIRADEDGSISLAARRGTANGSSAYYNPETECFEWVADTDTLEWTVYDLKAGYYDIFSDAALAMDYQGRPFILTMNNTFVTGTISYSRGLDRFRKRKFGNIDIKEDIPKAVFTLQHNLDGPQLSLRELRLIPVP